VSHDGYLVVTDTLPQGEGIYQAIIKNDAIDMQD